ncbi:pyridoxal phosphate-dependent deaminase, putative [hydrothermal vent metagenome]|uniref:Pyridoxal phosphate-dependent deaminase, putative n=1 Tax=hydrothermal vent metagenome TaxID=652676 RepID=A0A1W1BY82_9ZZZZ
MKYSSISKIILEGREFFIKRDDLIDPYLAGNKYRKLYTLLQTPSTTYDTIVSYGGTQSNAMVAIAAMTQKKGWHFSYYTKQLSHRQRKELSGNFANALALGMEHIELDDALYRDYIASLRLTANEKTFVIDQGGAISEARVGLEVLAQEIKAQKKSGEIEDDIYSLATPSGTGTTALFLALALPEYKIYTTPCIGDVAYLKEQMKALAPLPDNLIILPPKKKYHFAKPYKEFLAIYKKLLSSGIEFDLLYAPAMFEALLEQTDEKILYIHSGGVSGNGSMLVRYAQKGWNIR